MLLFYWTSQALSNYADGHVLVMAADVEAARQQARDQARVWLTENREWFFTPDGEVDPDEQEDYDAWMAQFEQDIAVEPRIDATVRLIRGSE
jgi:hypothetical protein